MGEMAHLPTLRRLLSQVGSVKVKTEPFPRSLVTVMAPPCASSSCGRAEGRVALQCNTAGGRSCTAAPER